MLIFVSALLHTSYNSFKRLILSNNAVNNSHHESSQARIEYMVTVRDALTAQLGYFDYSVGQI